ncbi:ABC transporter permease [Marinobacterium nitratireducens]|uniref:ABC transporter permease n=1 Tax=Marinobacterium nitratireducens TaxID=518897 RepID=A0A917ZDC9_9GAMM|nr:ABC transporter permease [Marinobacterium nitratireducens]
MLVLTVVLFAWLAPWLAPGDPFGQALLKALGPPDAAAPFGYDHLGRSMIQRLGAALRLSLLIAFFAVAAAAIFGVTLGLLAAARGGRLDRVLVLLSDSLLALPGLLLVLILAAVVPDKALAFAAGLALVLWIEFFRLTRATCRGLLTSPGVQASRLLGFGSIYVFRRHLWPEVAPLLLTTAAFGAATAIMTVASLGFVSVGMQAPTPELGLMMVELMPYWREAPLALLQPVFAIFLVLLGLNLMAGGRTI